MSRECLQCCCYPCVRCCCHDDVTEKKTDRYPHIHYQAPSQANVAVGSPEFRKVPLDKVFEFRQPHAEHSVHPIVSGDSGVVSDQPRSRDMSTPPPLASSRRLKHSSETTETSESSHTGVLPCLSLSHTHTHTHTLFLSLCVRVWYVFMGLICVCRVLVW